MKFADYTPKEVVDAARWFIDQDTDTDPVAVDSEIGPDGSPRRFGVLHSFDGQQRVEDGDYIIRHAPDEQGRQRLEAMSAQTFEAKYGPLEVQRDRAPKALKADK